MIRLTDAEVADLLACPYLRPREREAVRLCYREHMRRHIVARRLGVKQDTVTMLLLRARLRLNEDPPQATRTDGRNRHGGAPLDDAWFARNVEAIRTAIGGEEHQHRYLRCIEYLWGEDMRERMAIAAGLSP